MKARSIIVLVIAILCILPSLSTSRYYDPQTGRYLTPDPIGLDGGINPYAYVENDPVNRVDPFGLFIVGTLDSSTNAISLMDLDVYENVTGQGFTGGQAMPDRIISPGVPPYIPIPNGAYFIVDNPNPKPGHEDWYGLLMVDDRIDDYANDCDRGGFRLHLGCESWGCVTVNSFQPNAVKKWQEIRGLISNTSTIPNNLDYIEGPHFWNKSRKVTVYGIIYKR